MVCNMNKKIVNDNLKPVKALDALMRGIEIEVKKEKYRLINNEICTSYGEAYVGIDFSLNDFIKFCKYHMTDEEFSIIVANITLNSVKL